MSVSEPEDFILGYRTYVQHTRVPRLFNEWASVIAISSSLAQSCWILRDVYTVYPNLYVMLIGDPGTGKGTASAILQGVLQDAEFKRFAPDRTTKEKFLVDLEEGFDVDTESTGIGDNSSVDGFFASVLETPVGHALSPSNVCSDVLILAEELSDFFGTDNLDFVSMLTKLWSYTGTYRQRIKTGRSVKIPNPCINMYAATTHDSFQITFPSRLLGTGFLARFILVYGAVPSAKESAFPKRASREGRQHLGNLLLQIKNTIKGELTIAEPERLVLERILENYRGPEDARFKNYATRRFVQLLKLSICFAASRLSNNISLADIVQANTLLFATEQEMGKALGEFGKSKHSEISNKIMQALYAASAPMTAHQLWKLVDNDLSQMKELGDIMQNLQASEKIRFIDHPLNKAKSGYLAAVKPLKIRMPNDDSQKLVDDDYYHYLLGG